MATPNHTRQKCDGSKPICGQCIRARRPDDCEYTDGQGRSRTQILEENISRLEARIHELEHPDESLQSVTLHDPYSSQRSSTRGEIHLQAGAHSRSNGSASIPPSSLYPGLTRVLLGSRPDPAILWWTSEEPPLNIVQML
jgi:hypothetical protein